MKYWTVGIVVGAAFASPIALAQDASASLRAGCAADAQKFCAGVAQGGGRIIACLEEHRDQLSDQCKRAAANVAGHAAPGSAAPAQPPSAPSTTADASAGEAPAAVTPPGVTATTPKAGHPAASKPVVSSTEPTGGRFLRMKQVQVIAHVEDDALGKGTVDLPALDMPIPSSGPSRVRWARTPWRDASSTCMPCHGKRPVPMAGSTFKVRPSPASSTRG